MRRLGAPVKFQQGTAILERALPLCATTEKNLKTSREQIRAVHVLSAMILARAYSQSDNQQALSDQLDSLRELVARYEKALPQYDEESPRWLLGLALDLARRESNRLGASPHSPPQSAAE